MQSMGLQTGQTWPFRGDATWGCDHLLADREQVLCFSKLLQSLCLQPGSACHRTPGSDHYWGIFVWPASSRQEPGIRCIPAGIAQQRPADRADPAFQISCIVDTTRQPISKVRRLNSLIWVHAYSALVRCWIEATMCSLWEAQDKQPYPLGMKVGKGCPILAMLALMQL